jgi:hypothetical protein
MAKTGWNTLSGKNTNFFGSNVKFDLKSFSTNGQSNYGLGRFHPEAAFDQGCIAVLLLGAVEIGGITIRLRLWTSVGGSGAISAAAAHVGERGTK